MVRVERDVKIPVQWFLVRNSIESAVIRIFWLLSQVFSDVDFESRSQYLRHKPRKKRSVKPKIFFKTFRNPLFDGINVKDIFCSHLGSYFDFIVCYKSTPPLSKFVCRNF